MAEIPDSERVGNGIAFLIVSTVAACTVLYAIGRALDWFPAASKW